MLVIRNKQPYVFEAVGPVKYTPLKQWIAHGEDSKYIVRKLSHFWVALAFFARRNVPTGLT